MGQFESRHTIKKHKQSTRITSAKCVSVFVPRSFWKLLLSKFRGNSSVSSEKRTFSRARGGEGNQLMSGERRLVPAGAAERTSRQGPGTHQHGRIASTSSPSCFISARDHFPSSSSSSSARAHTHFFQHLSLRRTHLAAPPPHTLLH